MKKRRGRREESQVQGTRERCSRKKKKCDKKKEREGRTITKKIRSKEKKEHNATSKKEEERDGNLVKEEGGGEGKLYNIPSEVYYMIAEPSTHSFPPTYVIRYLYRCPHSL